MPAELHGHHQPLVVLLLVVLRADEEDAHPGAPLHPPPERKRLVLAEEGEYERSRPVPSAANTTSSPTSAPPYPGPNASARRSTLQHQLTPRGFPQRATTLPRSVCLESLVPPRRS
ncbi:hypothetical protein [Nonomuraea dietziae]|uniref:hypothetical protein n=1 Tax=Nonomuraea dietziae TaxID=65515 RepID=UPI0031D16CF0